MKVLGKSRIWHVYILECKGGRFYTGITDNLARRFKQHQSGQGGHFTRAFRAKRILYSENQPDKSAALKREAQIKSWPRNQKLKLIQAGSRGGKPGRNRAAALP